MKKNKSISNKIALADTGKNPLRFINFSNTGLADPPAGACLSDNRLARIWTLKKHYMLQTIANLRKGVSPLFLLRTQFPFHLPIGKTPPGVFVEFTNHCNLSCPYCPSPLNWRSQGMMSHETFARLISEIRAVRVQRVYIVGTGEPTLHPAFHEFVTELADAVKFLSLTSNWQRIDEKIVRTILDAPVNILNVSLDGMDAQSYESSRIGGNFERLVENLSLLRKMRQNSKQQTLVNIRVMVRPSQASKIKEITRFWKEYGDEVSIQYIVNHAGTGGDVYAINVATGAFPKCSLTFKQINVNWDGEVPLCTYSYRQADNTSEAILGNINKTSLLKLWKHPLITQYRNAHQKRNEAKMPICNGCGGC